MATLFIVATPIGNLEDITLRALRVLSETPALACEDTRMTRRLFTRHALPAPDTLFAYHDHNEARAGGRIAGLLDAGTDVALCTDGGFPGISDPGYRAVAAAHEAGHRVEVIPGASAVPTALLASGLPTSSFTFKGFPPRKSGPRQRWFAAEAALPHTLVVYESPYRVARTLGDAAEVLGPRLAAVCLELTKRHESVRRDSLGALASHFAEHAPRGEATLVIAGNHPKFRGTDAADAQSTETESE